jgi:hypothetical protein
MSKVKLITSFVKCTDAQLEIESQVILDKMTGNTYFPTPVPTLEQLKAARKAYETALAQVPGGGKEKVVIKNQKKGELANLLSSLALFVEQNSQDNEAIALSSGFDLAKKPAPVGNLPKPEKLLLADGTNPGEIEVSVESVKGAKSYFLQYTPDPLAPDSIWQSIPGTKSKITVKNLPSVKKYWFRVAGVGASPTLNFSDSLSRVVQ